MIQKFSIIVVNYGELELVLDFLDSLRNTKDTYLVSEVVIVDNGYPYKGDSSKTILRSTFPFEIKFVPNNESSYASGVNRGAAVCTGDFFIVANNDIKLLSTSSIIPMVKFLKLTPSAGIIGPQLIYSDGTWQRSYGQFPSIKEVLINLTMLDSLSKYCMVWLSRKNWWSKKTKLVPYIDGAFMVIRRTCFQELAGFNEDYSFYGEDSDFCKRARLIGWRTVFFPKVQVVHLRGASSTASALTEFTVRLYKAKQSWVRQHSGPFRAQCYGIFTRLVYFERAIFYSLLSKLVSSAILQQRANLAKACHLAIKEASRY